MARSSTKKKTPRRSPKHVYFFGGGKAEGTAKMKNLLGGKGANLAEMAGLGLPVPPGFTITTEVCTYFYDHKRKYPPALRADVEKNLHRVESIIGAKFGDAENPLLVSVRSGARSSMPGMMETILNVGLNDTTREGLIAKTGNPRFVYDAQRRLIQMYSDVVMEKAAGIEPAPPDAPVLLPRDETGACQNLQMLMDGRQRYRQRFREVRDARPPAAQPPATADPYAEENLLFRGVASVRFEEVDGRTRVTLHSVFPSVEAQEMAVASGMNHGIIESMERVDELLPEL